MAGGLGPAPMDRLAGQPELRQIVFQFGCPPLTVRKPDHRGVEGRLRADAEGEDDILLHEFSPTGF
jgi:hypothetical protein